MSEDGAQPERSMSRTALGEPTVRGDPERFRRLFMCKFDAVAELGLRPRIIVTLFGSAASMLESAMEIYVLSLERFCATGRGFRAVSNR